MRNNNIKRIKTNVLLLSRKRTKNKNSIEEMVYSILPRLNGVQFQEVPEGGGSLISLIKNLIFTFTLKRSVIHVVGDIHYVIPLIRNKSILTIHDVHSTLKGNWLSRKSKFILWYLIPTYFANRITVISEFTKTELIKILPSVKNKVEVINNPYNELIQFQEKSFIKNSPTILHIGTKSNKNLSRVIESLQGISCKLIIVGNLKTIHKDLLIENNTNYVNVVDVPYSEIVELYKKCDIVSFPSTYEGFGMPILEGNKAGRVVLTSNMCSMPEIGGNGVHYVNPYSVTDIRAGFLKLINDDKYRQKLINNGFTNIMRFSPEYIANQYNKLYQELLT